MRRQGYFSPLLNNAAKRPRQQCRSKPLNTFSWFRTRPVATRGVRTWGRFRQQPRRRWLAGGRGRFMGTAYGFEWRLTCSCQAPVGWTCNAF